MTAPNTPTTTTPATKTAPLALPILSFSVQAANNRLIGVGNPRGFVPQLTGGGIHEWAMKPDGCTSADRLAELAPGCGWVADRVMGLVHGGYDIGPYAGEAGRRCERVWPRPLNDDPARFAALAVLSVLRSRGLRPAVFVGSPPQMTFPDMSNALDGSAEMFSQAAKVASLAALGILTIFDTGGCVDRTSDAHAVFEELCDHAIPFYLEPTRPYHEAARSTVVQAIGLVSTTERMRTMENETKAGTRAWFDTAWLAEHGRHDVEWCTGISVQYAMERARLRLTSGRRVIVPLRLVGEDQIRQLHGWACAGAKTSDALMKPGFVTHLTAEGEIKMVRTGYRVDHHVDGEILTRPDLMIGGGHEA